MRTQSAEVREYSGGDLPVEKQRRKRSRVLPLDQTYLTAFMKIQAGRGKREINLCHFVINHLCLQGHY